MDHVFFPSARRLSKATGLLLSGAALGGMLLVAAPVTQAQGSPIPNPCESTIQNLPFSLDFSSEKGCVLDRDGERTGLTAYQPNEALKGVTAYQPSLIDLNTGDGTLTLTSTATISGNQVLGSLSRSDNTQVNALEVYFNASAPGGTVTRVFTVTARLKGPLDYIDVANEQAAVYFGPDQDNYVKLAILGGKPGGTAIEFIDEYKGQIRELQGAKESLDYSINAISDTIQTLDLMLVGDQEPGRISAYYAVNDQAPIKMPFDVTLPSTAVKNDFFNTGSDSTVPAPRAGILVAHKNQGFPIAVAFDSFSILNANRPSANAGADVPNAIAGNTINLNGIGYTDTNSSGYAITGYEWTQIGESTVTLNGSGQNRSFVVPSGSGVLTFSLVVTATKANQPSQVSAPDTMRVVYGESPITSLNAESSSPTVLGQATLFTATANISATNVSYVWDFGDGETGSGADTSHVYQQAGTYTATVVAKNAATTLGITKTTTVLVTNTAPTANAGAAQTVSAGSLVTLDGSASTDLDGHTPLSYTWTQTAGTPTVTLSGANTATPTFTAPSSPTQLTFELTVTDSRGASSTATVIVTVGESAIGSVQATSSSPTVLGATTFFTATATSTSSLTYSWNFGDGSAAGSGQNPTHVYTREGTFTTTLTVSTGSESRTASTRVVVTNAAPNANAGNAQSVEPGSQVTLSGSGSDPDNHLPLTYSWKQLSGAQVTLSGSGATRTFTAPQTSGTLVFELTVTDAKGKSSRDTVEIVVSPINLGSGKVLLPLVLK